MLHHTPRIVLVDDNPEHAFMAWERLTEAHHGPLQVDVVPSLAETLALLRAAPVDAIVLDLSLPDSQGLATLHRVRAAAGRAANIVVTGGVTAVLREQALAAGAEDVYDKADTRSALFSRSVLYVVERNRARLQQARLQLLLQTVPYAVAIADDRGAVRFANAAALAMFGCSDAAELVQHIDFSAAAGPARGVTAQHGANHPRCEVQVVPIEWEGTPALMASVKALPLVSLSALLANAGLENELRLRSDMLSSLSLQISHQMFGVTGLSTDAEQRSLQPLQSCYSHHFAGGRPALLASLHA